MKITDRGIKLTASKDLVRSLRILVVTSCTGKKRFKPANQLRLEDFQDSNQIQSRCAELSEFACRAGQMYVGQQHLQVIEGVNLLRQSFGREAIDLLILSAGYGLISEDKIIVPYEVTFNNMKGYEVDNWAKFLGIKSSFEQAIIGYDLAIVLVGKKYLRSLLLPIKTSLQQTFIFLSSYLGTKYIQDLTANTFILPLSNTEAKYYSYGLVGLKGFLFRQFAERVAKNRILLNKVYSEPEIFVQIVAPGLYQEEQNLCSSLLPLKPVEEQIFPKYNQSPKKNKIGKSEEEESISISELPAAPNLDLGMQYFIPEWDDRVDIGYNFLNDTLSPGRNPYTDDLYAHQIYPHPNYDGVLVSKAIVEKSKKKKAHIAEVGIHKAIRFPGQVMGDCGAFSYITEDNPPYTTEEILLYYQHSGFNYGVSIDHLIVGKFAQSGVREFRYELTLFNAAEFIQKHQARGYTFTPIGAVQGWNPQSYADAVKACIDMGYDYIALGGLARTPSREILEVLHSIYPHLTAKTRIHLFGVGRLNTIEAFRHLGVSSFDSASPLRKAWLDSAANYHTFLGKTYAAIRIPKVDRFGTRIKSLLEAGIDNLETLKQLEENALLSLREFDAGKISLQSTLEALLDYDKLLALPKSGQADPVALARRTARHAKMYRQLLEDRPWLACDCPICQEIGVEVIIFRGNDRNRRRGFHNTYIFYKRFKSLLNAK